MQHIFRSAWIAAACAALAVPALAQSKYKLERETKVEDWGFKIRLIENWNSLVPDQDEKYCVGRWKMNLDELRRRGLYDAYESASYCELLIMRIPTSAVTGNRGADALEKAEEQGIRVTDEMRKRLDPKSVDDWIEGHYDGAAKRWLRAPLEGGEMEGELIHFGSGAEHILVGRFERPGCEWAVVYTAFEETYRRDWEEIYTESIKSFDIYEDVDADVAASARRDLTKLEGEELRKALHDSIAGSPGWYAIDTDHYVILSNSDKQSFIKQLAKELEVVRKKVYTKMFPPRNKKTPLSPVRVLDTQSEYHQYGGPSGSAGYFSPSSGELVLFTKFENVSNSSSLDYCRSVMFHEAFHQYIHFAVGDVSPHSWFNEGHGDFFAGMEVRGSRVKNKEFDWRVDFLKTHLRKGKDLIPVRSLVRYPQREYYSNAGLKYSQGWALIYFLREVSRDKSHKKILDKYFEYLADNVEAFRAKKKDGDGTENPDPVPGIPGIRIIDWEDQEKVEEILSKAVDTAFEGVDLEKLDRELRAWVEKL